MMSDPGPEWRRKGPENGLPLCNVLLLRANPSRDALYPVKAGGERGVNDTGDQWTEFEVVREGKNDSFGKNLEYRE